MLGTAAGFESSDNIWTASLSTDCKTEARAALTVGQKHIEIDLSQTMFLDSCGLGTLIFRGVAMVDSTRILAGALPAAALAVAADLLSS